MASTALRKQDMPPPGGFKPLDYSRVPAKELLGSKKLMFAHLVVSGVALYIYAKSARKIEKEKIELRSAMFAITPLLTAERDREFLKQLRRNREAEARLMENVEGWEVGRSDGKPIYKTISEDVLIPPTLNEYFIHTPLKYLKQYKDFLLWD